MSNTSLTTKVTQSRGWTLALGIAAAALAAILLIAYLVQYRSSVNDSTAPTPVLVAKNLIPKGTSGTVIAEKQLFQAATLAKDDLKVGAISDPAYLNGRVAVADIFPGQQITTADLSAGLTDAIPTQLTGIQRAVAIPVERRPRPRRLRRERRPRRHLLRERLRRRARILGLLAPERPRDARARRRGAARDPARRRRHSRRSSRSRPTRARSGSCSARPATRRTPPKKADHERRAPRPQIHGTAR